MVVSQIFSGTRQRERGHAPGCRVTQCGGGCASSRAVVNPHFPTSALQGAAGTEDISCRLQLGNYDGRSDFIEPSGSPHPWPRVSLMRRIHDNQPSFCGNCQFAEFESVREFAGAADVATGNSRSKRKPFCTGGAAAGLRIKGCGRPALYREQVVTGCLWRMKKPRKYVAAVSGL